MMMLSMRQTVQQRLRQALDFENYESAGDLELFSLYRIKNRIGSLGISTELKKRLVMELIRQNREYKAETGNDWNCLTPNLLDTAIDETYSYLKKNIESGVATMEEGSLKYAAKKVFADEAEKTKTAVKNWFYDNYSLLIYDTNNKIPRAIVMKMRGELRDWAVSNANPFSKPIEQLIEETIKDKDLDPESFESHQDMWQYLADIVNEGGNQNASHI